MVPDCLRMAVAYKGSDSITSLTKGGQSSSGTKSWRSDIDEITALGVLKRYELDTICGKR